MLHKINDISFITLLPKNVLYFYSLQSQLFSIITRNSEAFENYEKYLGKSIYTGADLKKQLRLYINF